MCPWIAWEGKAEKDTVKGAPVGRDISHMRFMAMNNSNKDLVWARRELRNWERKNEF